MGIFCSSDCTIDFQSSKNSCNAGKRSEQQDGYHSTSSFEDSAPSKSNDATFLEGTHHSRMTSCVQWSIVAAASGESLITATIDLSPGVHDALEDSFEENEDDDGDENVPDPIPAKFLGRLQQKSSKGNDIANTLSDLYTKTEETAMPTCTSPGDN
jgi:hypothetical protein